MIRYSDIISESVVDGIGLRTTVFLQGCPRHCVECQNPNLIPINGGILIDEEKLAYLILQYITPIHRGITFSGGDPLLQPDSLFKLITLIKNKNKNLDIWVYTGFLFEEIQTMQVINVIDVIVDGPFLLEKKDLTLQFRGSTNQRIINIKH